MIYRKHYKSITVVIAVLLVLAVCGLSVYATRNVYNTTRSNLINEAGDKIALISENTSSFLRTSKTLAASFAGAADNIIANGGSNEDILNFLLYQTEHEPASVDFSFSGVYGFFRGEYLDGNGWNPFADGGEYHPMERPWYINALAVPDEVCVSSPYIDEGTGNIVLSVSKLLSDGESVIALDIDISGLSEYVDEYIDGIYFEYGYIVDGTGTVVASKNSSETGINFLADDAGNGSCGLARLFGLVQSSTEPFEYTIDGRTYLVVSRTVENSWRVIAAAETEGYSAALHRVVLMCVVLMTLVASVVLFFLTNSLNEKKQRIEAQRNEKKYVDELKDISDRLSAYKTAVLSDALVSLEVNLSTDELAYGVWKDVEGQEIQPEKCIGMSLPCSYDKYVNDESCSLAKEFGSTDFSRHAGRMRLLEAFENGRTEVSFDYDAKTMSGRTIHLRRTVNMTRNHAGDVIAYTCVKDITEQTEQAEREEIYIRALATGYDSIVVIGFEDDKFSDRIIMRSRITDSIASLIDEETANETGYSKKLDKFLKFVYPEDRDEFWTNTRREAIFASFSENRNHSVRFRIIDPNGTYLHYRLRFIPLPARDGKLTGMLACMRNTDAETRRELAATQALEDAKLAAESANRAKTTFLFNMSHDIRTPMNAIIGFTELAEKHIDDRERVESALGKIKFSSNHLLSIINDVLDMARVESGQIQIVEEPVFLDTAKDNLYSILNASAEAKGLKLILELDPSLKHHWFYSDRMRMTRVLTNIVSNSVKYTPSGGTVRLLTEELPCDREGYARICYSVSDNGIGMSPEFLEHVFEPFSRAESSTVSGVSGTGLGMAITKSLTEMMGGTISIESEQGVGTTVRLVFDHRIAEPALPKAAAEESALFDFEGRKILLVEDNEMNREIAAEILEEEGIIVDTAEDGDIAVEKMRTAADGQYDLILMDIQMPRMNGYEATRAIRKLPGEYASGIPIVAMTANAFEEDKKNAMEAGMNAHLAKPIDIPKLFETLSSFFS